jgi:hypothetical protein
MVRSLVFVLALALAANGAAIRPCAAAAQAAGQPSMSHDHRQQQHASHASEHGQHHQHAGHDHAAAAPDDTAVAGDHAPAKCCSMCTLASMLPSRVDASAPFSATAVFPRLTDHGSGTDIRVDPGIPKHIA